jgi:hypothetical protein
MAHYTITGPADCCCGESPTCCSGEGSTVTFTIAGVAAGLTAGCNCSAAFNRTWTLLALLPSYINWSVTYLEVPTCAEQTSVTATAECADGVVTVAIYAGADPVAEYQGSMYCSGPSVLSLVDPGPDPAGILCTDWPATISVTFA